MELNKYIDHTELKAIATTDDITQLCKEAEEYNFYAVCVNGSYVEIARRALKGTEVKVAAVVGFPLGAMSTPAKAYEAATCCDAGADEIDMVLNIGWLKSGEEEKVLQDISAVKNAIGDHVLKVIIETCYLTDEEKKLACKLALKAGAEYVKTSTGFGTGGATLEDVKLMKEVVGDKAKIKASGGIRDAKTAAKYIEAGVSRIGASAGINIVSEQHHI